MILSQPGSDTLEVGLNGFTKTFSWTTGTPSSNGQVKSVSDTGNCAINLASAINDAAIGGTYAAEGTDWTNTDGANPYLTATVSGSTITLTDKIACSRSLGFVTTASDSDKVSVSPIRGGVDGTLVAEISAGNASASSTLSSGVNLDAEDQTTSTLPPGIAGPSNVIQTRGRFAVDIRLASAPDDALALKIQLSNDGTNFFDAPTTTISNLNSDQTQHLVADDLFSEFMRVFITSNASTVANPALIKVISQS